MIRVRYWSPGWGLQEPRTTIAARTSMRPYPRTEGPRFPAEFSLRPVLAVETTSASQPFRAVAFACFGQKRAMAYNSSARRLWTLHLERHSRGDPWCAHRSLRGAGVGAIGAAS